MFKVYSTGSDQRTIERGYMPAEVADELGLGSYDLRIAAVNDLHDPDNYARVIEYIEDNL